MLLHFPMACSSACSGSLLCKLSICQEQAAPAGTVAGDDGVQLAPSMITTVTEAKGFAQPGRRGRVFSRKAQSARRAAMEGPRRTIMNAARMLTVAALCTVLSGAGFAQVTGKTIQERKTDQQQRIAQGVRSGQLTAHETANLERREASVNREERAMRRADGGHLTRQDKAALTRRQNHISKSIYRDKHNAAVR
jgi:hypothetical protein